MERPSPGGGSPARRRWSRARSDHRRGSGTGPPIPAHLPELEVVVEPPSTACPCCSGAMHRIGEDVSRRLDVAPA